MSGYSNRRSRFGARNSNTRMEWRPKPKIANDESLDNASSGLKDNSSLPVDSTPEKVLDFNPKLVLDIPFQQDSPLPVIKDVASGLKQLELTAYSCQRADSGPNHPGSVTDSVLNYPGSAADSGSNHPRSVRDIGLNHPGPSADSGSDYPLPTADRGLNHPVPTADSGSNHLRPVLTSNSSEISDRVSPFDICPMSSNPVVKLKAPLHVKNKEKRKQNKQFVEGPNIIVLRPGMVLMKGYISIKDQVSIVKTCRELGIGDGGFYQPGYRDGSTLHLKMMCLGKNWDPESSKYGDIRPIDDAKPPGIPDKFCDLMKRAIQGSNDHTEKRFDKTDARNNILNMLPDICIVNFYTKGGKLGLHQDKDESPESIERGLPVVSFSIGDSAEFLYGDVRDIDKAAKVVLESGDVLIFGGRSRRIFHGVASILPDTSPAMLLEETDLRPGRLNLTFRQF